MFRCNACSAKDSHIADLKEQVALLRKLVFPAQAKTVSEEDLQRDSLLAGGSLVMDPIEMINDKINSEAALLLSGNYDTDNSEI